MVGREQLGAPPDQLHGRYPLGTRRQAAQRLNIAGVVVDPPALFGPHHADQRTAGRVGVELEVPERGNLRADPRRRLLSGQPRPPVAGTRPPPPERPPRRPPTRRPPGCALGTATLPRESLVPCQESARADAWLPRTRRSPVQRPALADGPGGRPAQPTRAHQGSRSGPPLRLKLAGDRASQVHRVAGLQRFLRIREHRARCLVAELQPPMLTRPACHLERGAPYPRVPGPQDVRRGDRVRQPRPYPLIGEVTRKGQQPDPAPKA